MVLKSSKSLLSTHDCLGFASAGVRKHFGTISAKGRGRYNHTKSSVLKHILISILLGLFSFEELFAGVEEPASVELERFFALLEEEAPLITLGAARPLAKEKMQATVTVITAEEIKLLGLRHLTDVINYMVPGGIGDIHTGDRTGLFNFRGISVDNNAKFVFMVDGLNTNLITTNGAINELYLGLLDELDRIEITQGAGSTLYGDGAISGVINFITKTGKAFQGWEITSGYGHWKKMEHTIKYGRQASEDEDDFFYFGFKRSHGSKPKDGGGSPTQPNFVSEHAGDGRHWDHFDPSFKFHGNIHRGDLTLRLRYVQERYEEPYIFNVNSVSSTTEFGATADRFVENKYFTIMPEIKHRFNKDHSIKANLSFQLQERHEIKIKDWFGGPGGETIVKKDDERLAWGERKLRGQFFHYYDGWENHRLTTGGELFWMHIGPDFNGYNFRIRNVGGTRVKDKSKRRDNYYFAAFFIEDIWQIDDKSTFFAGVRLENHNKTPFSIMPRFALTHKLDEKTDIKLLYNTGFRTPPQVVFVSNERRGVPDPDPEKVQSWEAHILHKWNDKFSTSLIGYYTIYEDLINFFSGSGLGFVNFKKVKAAGLELTGDYKTKNLKLKFSHSYSRPEHFSSQAFEVTQLSYNLRDWAQFPTHLTKASAIINLIEDKCILGITYLRPWAIRGQRNIDSKLKNPADYINATLTLKLNKDMEVQISGYNLTGEDRPWWGDNTVDGVSRDINPHREYFVRLIWRF